MAHQAKKVVLKVQCSLPDDMFQELRERYPDLSDRNLVYEALRQLWLQTQNNPLAPPPPILAALAAGQDGWRAPAGDASQLLPPLVTVACPIPAHWVSELLLAYAPAENSTQLVQAILQATWRAFQKVRRAQLLAQLGPANPGN